MNKLTNEKYPNRRGLISYNPNSESHAITFCIPPSRYFVNGLNYSYFRTHNVKGFREWYCCWSRNKNKNNRYLSWVYEWVKSTGHVKLTRIREHKRKYKAKARAMKMYKQRISVIEKGHSS